MIEKIINLEKKKFYLNTICYLDTIWMTMKCLNMLTPHMESNGSQQLKKKYILHHLKL